MFNQRRSAYLQYWGIRTIFFWAAVLILSGCVGLIIKPYGHVASDHEKVKKDGHPVGVNMPENAPSISQGYNPQFSETENIKSPTGHHGIDIIAKTGTPVMASAAGVVFRSYADLFYGNRITIDHGQDASGQFIQSRYLHLKKKMVKEGDTVVRGQQIATLGRTGLLAGFPHLHYEIRISDPLDPTQFHSVNPHKFWAEGVGMVTCFEKNRHWPARPFQTTYPVPCLGVAWQ
jgi:murein DD-endopeptidase MepM/ murein hydrolase activator NlpD